MQNRQNSFVIEWLILISALLLLGGLLGKSLHDEHQAIGQREQERLNTQTKVIHDNLVRQLDVVNRAMLNIRQQLPSWHPRPDGMELATAQLATFADVMPGVRTMTILDADGRILAASRPEIKPGTNFRERPYFQAVLQKPDADTLYLGPPFKTSLGAWGMNVVRMVTGPQGEFGGAIATTLEAEEFRSLLDSVRYADDMRAYLAHGNGDLFLLSPEIPGTQGKNLATPDSMLSRHIASGETASVMTGLIIATGEHSLIAQRTLQPPSLHLDQAINIAVSRNVDALYAPWWREAYLTLGMFTLLAAIALPGLYWLQCRRRSAEQDVQTAQAAVADSERFLRLLIDVIPGMVGYWDADLRNRYANIAYLAWFGKTPEQMRGIRIQDMLGEALFQANAPYINAALRGERLQFERTLTKADGSTGYVWAHYIPDIDPHDPQHRVRGFFVLVSDITELKLTQQNLETRSREAEAANRAKSLFLANMSHEIRTPMNAVIGLLQLLQDTELSPRQRDYASKAHTAARSLLGILNDILDFSKVEAGKLDVEHHPFALDQLLRNLSVVLSAAASDKNIEVLFDLDPHLPRALSGDALRLQQVLLNLAGNAIKFTHQGEVVVGLRLIDKTSDHARIEFFVTDTGIGIQPEHQRAIFDGFTQAEASTSRRFGGTGLGLAISQRLVRLMQGELTVNSTPGQGSRFAFTLDFSLDTATDATEATHQRQPHTADQPPLRVLVVDDNPVARDILSAMARSMGWEVDAVTSGAEALARFGQPPQPGPARMPPDVLLIDSDMPGMDGWETVRHLRQSAAFGPAHKLIMIGAHLHEAKSAFHNQPTDGQTPADSIDNFLVKPLTPSMLFDAIADATTGRSSSRYPERSASPPQALAGLRLLVVEDNYINQQVAQELLAREGAYVEVASSGQEGIDRISSTRPPFDAILMDIQMPDMDGFTATRILRQDLHLNHLPIIAMTANALPADRAACLAAGMNDHVGKPIDIDRLTATLLHHCGHPSSPPPELPDAQFDAQFDGQPAVPPEPTSATGFELHDALLRLGDNHELFARLARGFRSDQGGVVIDIRNALRQADNPTATRLLHTLKGLAATLGATALARFSADAEAAVKAGIDASGRESLTRQLQALLDTAMDQLENFANQLTPPVAAPPPPAADSPTASDLTEQLLALEELLTHNNMRALDAHAALRAALCAAFDSRHEGDLGALNHAMGQLDFPTALEKCRNLRAILTP